MKEDTDYTRKRHSDESKKKISEASLEQWKTRPRAKKEARICEQCKILFTVKWNKGANRFCSKNCADIAKTGSTYNTSKRYIDKNGYVHIWMGVGVGGKYKLEHRLTMEQKLGRALTQEETVHHINGDRQDNRLENLELWTGKHGKGVRVSDISSGLKGLWKLDVYDGDIRKDSSGKILNRLVSQISGSNLVTTVGKQMIMDRLFGLSAVGAMTRIGVGTSATAAAVGDTTLTGSAFKVYDATPIRTSTTVTCITTFGTSEANLNWQELGMDNGTTLLNRIAPIGPFNKTSAVSIVVTVSLVQS